MLVISCVLDSRTLLVDAITAMKEEAWSKLIYLSLLITEIITNNQ